MHTITERPPLTNFAWLPLQLRISNPRRLRSATMSRKVGMSTWSTPPPRYRKVTRAAGLYVPEMPARFMTSMMRSRPARSHTGMTAYPIGWA